MPFLGYHSVSRLLSGSSIKDVHASYHSKRITRLNVHLSELTFVLLSFTFQLNFILFLSCFILSSLWFICISIILSFFYIFCVSLFLSFFHTFILLSFLCVCVSVFLAFFHYFIFSVCLCSCLSIVIFQYKTICILHFALQLYIILMELSIDF